MTIPKMVKMHFAMTFVLCVHLNAFARSPEFLPETTKLADTEDLVRISEVENVSTIWAKDKKLEVRMVAVFQTGIPYDLREFTFTFRNHTENLGNYAESISFQVGMFASLLRNVVIQRNVKNPSSYFMRFSAKNYEEVSDGNNGGAIVYPWRNYVLHINVDQKGNVISVQHLKAK